MKGLRKALPGILILVCAITVACASIPPEAPEMSAELGKRIAAIQDANLSLLHRFFDLKRAEVDRFIQNEWVPTLAQEVFSDSKIKKTWDIIVAENNPVDRLTFLVITGPKLQERINLKRAELIKPLDEIERRIEENLRNEYAQAGAINNTITSFLFSASKVDQNRNRYLAMTGITESKIGNAIDKVNTTVSDLVSGAKKVEGNAIKGEEYLKKLKVIKDSLISSKKEG